MLLSTMNSQRPFRCLATLAAIAILALASNAFAQEKAKDSQATKEPAEVTTELELLNPFLEKTEDAAKKYVATQDPVYSARLTDIELRLAALEKKAISAEEAREIATAVVEEKLAELKLAIQKPTGGQRTESVTLSTSAPTSGIVLNPGETLLGYTDASTGRYVDLSNQQPVVSNYGYSSFDCSSGSCVPTATYGSYGSPVYVDSQPRTVTTQQRFLFRPRASTMRSSGSCRVVNGRMVCN